MEQPKRPETLANLQAVIHLYNSARDKYIGFSLDGKPESRIELLKYLYRISATIAAWNQEPVISGVDYDELEGYGFHFDGERRIVGFHNRPYFNNALTTRVSFEYDEKGRVARINTAYARDSYHCVELRYPDTKALTPSEYLTFAETLGVEGRTKGHTFTIPADLESMTAHIFPNPLSVPEKNRLRRRLKFTPEHINVYMSRSERGIVFKNEREILEALVIYGEGQHARWDESTNLQRESDAWDEALGFDIISEFDGSNSETVLQFVMRNFPFLAPNSPMFGGLQPGHEFSKSFDYDDFNGFGFNSFHKSSITVSRTEDGRYILRIWEGARGNYGEKQMARALGHNRVVEAAAIKLDFPSRDGHFLVSGLQPIQKALEQAGFTFLYDLNKLIAAEYPGRIEEIFNADTNDLTYGYIYPSYKERNSIVAIMQNLPIRINIELKMPRAHRSGYAFELVDGAGKISHFDSWSFHEDNTEVLGPVFVDIKGISHTPYLAVNIEPIVGAFSALGLDAYSQDIVDLIEHLAESIKIAISEINMNKQEAPVAKLNLKIRTAEQIFRAYSKEFRGMGITSPTHLQVYFNSLILRKNHFTEVERELFELITQGQS